MKVDDSDVTALNGSVFAFKSPGSMEYVLRLEPRRKACEGWSTYRNIVLEMMSFDPARSKYEMRLSADALLRKYFVSTANPESRLTDLELTLDHPAHHENAWYAAIRAGPVPCTNGECRKPSHYIWYGRHAEEARRKAGVEERKDGEKSAAEDFIDDLDMEDADLTRFLTSQKPSSLKRCDSESAMASQLQRKQDFEDAGSPRLR